VSVRAAGARRRRFRLLLAGAGAMNSPRYAPAGLLVDHDRHRIMLDGGPGSAPTAAPLDAWLLTDERAELIGEIRELARSRGVEPRVAAYRAAGLEFAPLPVVHTSHPTYGYLIRAGRRRIVWAPEFLLFPAWAAGADLMFAEASGFERPIRFAGGVGGHAAALDVAAEARRRGVRRLIFAHIGRPTIRAVDSGRRPPFGRLGRDGEVFYPGRWRG
jgi:Beta-lactamase superfamily domain